jgi:chromate transporter
VGRDLPPVAAAFAGVWPAVGALVMLAAWRIGWRSIRSPLLAAIAAAAFLALARGTPFPAVVAVAGLIGWLAIEGPAAAASARQTAGGDSTTRFDAEPPPAGLVRHAVLVAAVAVAIWGACYAIVRVTAAAGGRGAAIAGLFTETTLLSFGGAYAVVPWALDEAVGRGWIDAGERFAAVALGEATPGPLILVVTFIGFLAGWKWAPETALAAGIGGTATATLFAFLPSFARRGAGE